MSTRDRSRRERSGTPAQAFCSTCGRPVKGGKGATRCDHCSTKKASKRSREPDAPSVSDVMDRMEQLFEKHLRPKRSKVKRRGSRSPRSGSPPVRSDRDGSGSGSSHSSSSSSSSSSPPPSGKIPPDLQELLDLGDSSSEDEASVAAICAHTDALIKRAAKVLHLEEIIEEPETKNKKSKKKKDMVPMADPPKRRQFFSGHDDFQIGVTAAWEHPDKVPALPRFLDHKYPFSKGWLKEWATAQPVDSQLTSLNSERLLPAVDAAGISDPGDRKMEHDARLGYSYATATLRPVLASSWFSLVIFHRLEYLASVMAPTAPVEVTKWLIPELSLLKEYAEFIKNAAMDSGKLLGHASAIFASLRCALWLKGREGWMERE